MSGDGGRRGAALDVPAMALLFALCTIWGLNQVAIKVGHAGISPLTQAGLRSAIAAACLLVWAAARGIRVVRRDGTLGYGVTIALLFGVEFVCIYWGLVFTTASRAVLFVYLSPFVVALGAHFLLPDERLTRRKALGLVCAFPDWPSPSPTACGCRHGAS